MQYILTRLIDCSVTLEVRISNLSVISVLKIVILLYSKIVVYFTDQTRKPNNELELTRYCKVRRKRMVHQLMLFKSLSVVI